MHPFLLTQLRKKKWNYRTRNIIHLSSMYQPWVSSSAFKIQQTTTFQKRREYVHAFPSLQNSRGIHEKVITS